MDILITHFLLEYHRCRFSSDNLSWTDKLKDLLIKYNIFSAEDEHSLITEESVLLVISRPGQQTSMQYFPESKVLLVDLKLRKVPKDIQKLFQEIKKLAGCRHFQNLEVKRGIWDRNSADESIQ